MNKSRLTLAVMGALLAFSKISAQSVTTNSVSYIEKVATVNFMEIANYERTHPKPLVRKLPFDEGEESGDRPYRPPVDPSSIRMYLGGSAHGAETPHTAYLPVSPSPADTFLAKVSDGTSIPPDTHGAVDSMYAVTAINTSVTIENRYTHAVVSTVTLDGFWSSMETSSSGGHGTGAYDPRVHYDPHFKRWIMLADAYGETTYSQMFIAVSSTSSPTGAWHMYRLNLSNTSGLWLDFPCVGFNKKWIAISGNFFTSAGSFTADSVYVLDYAAMRAGSALGTFGRIKPPGSTFTVCPALTYDTTETNLFCIENYNGGSGQLKLFKITGNIGAGLTMTSVATPTTGTHWQQSAGSGDFVRQLGGGTTYKLQANDDRINNFVQRNNKLWCAHSIFLPSSGTPTRVSSMWWQMDTAGVPAQVGVIDDATAVNNYWFPSIAPNASDDALIGFATASTAIYPSCGYALHLHSDASASSRPVYTYRHGQKTYYQTFGGSQCRWGDYSATCIDPVNNLDFWTLQESVPSASSAAPNSKWDTWWAHVVVCTPLSTVPTPATITASPCEGTIAPYSVDTVAGATSYVWTVTGTGWSGTSTTDSINLTVGSGTATITVAPANSCATGTGIYSFVVTPIPLAVETMSVTPSSICVGATSALFTTTATGSPTSYTWTVTGTGWSGSSTTSSLNATVGTGTGIITVTGTNGCGTGPVATMTVTPTSGPPTPAPITPPTLVCASSTGDFTVPAVTGSGTVSYTWTIIGTGWSGASATNTVNVTIGTGTAYVIVNATDGCGTSADDTLTIDASTGPGASTAITATTSPLCSGSTAVFTTPALPLATSYIWTVTGTGWSGTSTTNSITVTVGTGVATITVTPVNACGNGTPFTLNSIVPIITPTATFIESTHVTTVLTSITCTYTGIAPSGTTYLWSFSGGGIATSGATSPGPMTVYWTTPGTYTVSLTVNNGGCTATYTDTVHVNNGVGIQQVNIKSFDANIIPNPSDGTFDLVFDQQIMQPVSVKISDMEGRTVYTNEFGSTIDNKISIITNHLAAGNYNATIFVDGAIITRKVTISK